MNIEYCFVNIAIRNGIRFDHTEFKYWLRLSLFGTSSKQFVVFVILASVFFI